MNKVSGQIEEFFSISAIWLLFLVNMSKKISLSVEMKLKTRKSVPIQNRS